MMVRRIAGLFLIAVLSVSPLPGADEKERIDGFKSKAVVKLEADPQEEVESSAKDPSYTLIINGTGLCEWGIFGIDLYKAALYLEDKCREAEKIIASKGAKRIHLLFSRSLSKEQLQDAYTASLKVNAGDAFAQYEKRLGQLKKMLEDVEKGDSLVFTYFPDSGIEVKLKGERKGWIKGEDFGSMFFRLYLGEHPPTEDLKNGLLGLEED